MKLYEDHLAALVEAQQPAAHVQKPAEIEHVAGDVSKNGAESNMTQQPASSAAAVDEEFLRSVITLCNNRGASPESIENFDSDDRWIADLWRQAEHLIATTPQAGRQPAPDEIINMAREQGLPETETEGVFIVNVDDLGRVFAAYRAARAPADSGTAPAGGADWQDISTAPKDGTRFVAVGQNYGLDSEAQHTCIAQWLAGCWVEVSDWNGASKLKYLTHWMPLPPLPCSAGRAPADSVLEDAETALRKVLGVVQRYLPPDGPTAHDAMTEITAIVDPWPLGPLEKL